MNTLIYGAIAHLKSFIQTLQIKRLVTVACLSFMVLAATNVDTGAGANTKTLNPQIKQDVNQLDSVRPKTTREWQQEARDVKGEPGERIQAIGEESAKAVEEFGELFNDTLDRSTNGSNTRVTR
ncbi:MAG: hypothetical protein KME20_05560 [Kaiparowitsia implicata GSE-PSE-MK54-09C]|nr:hypothetical protein [Kaiparowitsia implicata GSE-PSE-MK54-09C]